MDHTDIERLKRDAVIGRQIRSNNTIGYLLERLRQVEVQVSLIREELRQLEDSFK